MATNDKTLATMTMSIHEMRNSLDEKVRCRASILNERQLHAWLESHVLQKTASDGFRPKRSGITIEVPYDKFEKGQFDAELTLTVGFRDWLVMDVDSMNEVLGTPISTDKTGTTVYRNWEITVDQWPFITVEWIAGHLFTGRNAGYKPLPELLLKQFTSFFPSTSIEQLRLWYDNDMLALDPEHTHAPQLYELLLQNEMKYHLDADLPDSLDLC